MAASESSVAILQSSTPDKYFHSASRSYGGTTKEDQYFLLASSAWPTYTAIAQAISTATSASHLMFIQGDGTNYTRIFGIKIEQSTLAGAAATANLQLIRTSTAGSGGTSVTAVARDSSDSSYGGTIMTLPTSKGTEGSTLETRQLGLVAAQPMNELNKWIWFADLNLKPIIIGSASTDGMCLKIVTGIATAKVDITFYFTVTPTL